MFSDHTAQELQCLVDLTTFIGIVTARAINSTTKVKTIDLMQAGSYSNRVAKRIDKALGCGTETAEEYLRLTMGVNQYENLKQLQGLGGSTPITLEQALQEATL